MQYTEEQKKEIELTNALNFIQYNQKNFELLFKNARYQKYFNNHFKKIAYEVKKDAQSISKMYDERSKYIKNNREIKEAEIKKITENIITQSNDAIQKTVKTELKKATFEIKKHVKKTISANTRVYKKAFKKLLVITQKEVDRILINGMYKCCNFIFLHVRGGGRAKSYVVKIKQNGKERVISIGSAFKISLKQALKEGQKLIFQINEDDSFFEKRREKKKEVQKMKRQIQEDNENKEIVKLKNIFLTKNKSIYLSLMLLWVAKIPPI